MRYASIIAVLSFILVGSAAPASARRAYYEYRATNTNAPVEGGSGRHTARLSSILLSSSFDVKQRRSTYLAFGPVGSCRSTGSIRPVLVHSTATTASRVVEEVLPEGHSYGSGRRSDSAWKIVKSGTATLRGAYARPTQLPDVWIVVRVATTPHRSCHTGGYRESVAQPLADALAATRASGY